MIDLRHSRLSFALGASFLIGATVLAQPSTLLPTVKEAKWEKGSWKPGRSFALRFERSEERRLAPAIVGLKDALGVSKVDPESNSVVQISLNPALRHPEGYRLTINSSGVQIEGNDPAGAYYAVQTLRQLRDNNKFQFGTITDWPSFPLRGFMHDVGRNFQTIESLKQQLDILAAYKINTLHWHLTDNPGWRIECLAYPQLNDPANYTRDKGKFYRYSEIRDFLAYAKRLFIKVIPELDMPGHGAYFTKTFGFDMGSEQGRDVLEKLIDEFCTQIPKDDCPIIHLGSDEVRIKNPDEFMTRMSNRVKAHFRQPMVWNPGLKSDSDTIIQVWTETEAEKVMKTATSPIVDSANGYLNNYDPLKIVEKYFNWRPCFVEQGDDRHLGGILCCWPDVRVEDKANIFRHNAVWPGLLAFSESTWRGGSPKTSYSEFESRLAVHRDSYFKNLPFPFVKSSHIPWQVATGSDQRTILYRFFGPVDSSVTSVKSGFVDFKSNGLPDASAGYAQTYFFSPTAGSRRAWIGFESPARSNRQSGGIPAYGEWTAFGANVWINGTPVKPPTWKNPSTRQYLKPTWSHPANEDPYEDEEFYWTREPAEFAVKPGWNRVLVRVPKGYPEQRWTFTFVPVKLSSYSRWIEDETLKFAIRPNEKSLPSNP